MNRLTDALRFMCLGCAAMPGQPCVTASGNRYPRGGYVHSDRLVQAMRAERGTTVPHEPTASERAVET